MGRFAIGRHTFGIEENTHLLQPGGLNFLQFHLTRPQSQEASMQLAEAIRVAVEDYLGEGAVRHVGVRSRQVRVEFAAPPWAARTTLAHMVSLVGSTIAERQLETNPDETSGGGIIPVRKVALLKGVGIVGGAAVAGGLLLRRVLSRSP